MTALPQHPLAPLPGLADDRATEMAEMTDAELVQVPGAGRPAADDVVTTQ